jgi:predicted ester cyclase
MSAEQNKDLIRRIPEEVFNQGKLDLIDELFVADYVEHAAIPPQFSPDIPGLKRFISALRAAFPDFRYTIEDQIAEGDKVVTRVTARGTHNGEFLGIPATGKQVEWGEIHIGRISGGKLVEHWVVQDQLGLLQQLGVVPVPGQANR